MTMAQWVGRTVAIGVVGVGNGNFTKGKASTNGVFSIGRLIGRQTFTRVKTPNGYGFQRPIYHGLE